MSSNRPRAGSAELKVPHTRIDEEKVLEETYKYGCLIVLTCFKLFC